MTRTSETKIAARRAVRDALGKFSNHMVVLEDRRVPKYLEEAREVVAKLEELQRVIEEDL